MRSEALTRHLEKLKADHRPLFIPYLMCGDGGFENTKRLLNLLEDSGASVIEIGIPFSDPIADGPTIQAAGQRALDSGITLKAIVAFLMENPIRNGVPRVVMTYLNPLIQYGLESFITDIAKAQVSGLIIPDLPYEEFDRLLPLTRKHGLHLIPLIAPATSPNRLSAILEKASGFVYTITVNGTTGEGRTFPPALLQRLDQIRTLTDLPVVAGFGISTREQIDTLSPHCDGVVVGSRIVTLAHQKNWNAIAELMA